MKKTVLQIFAILKGSEKRKMIKLILSDVAISLVDIIFLALLLYVIHFYTDSSPEDRFRYSPSLFRKYPLLLISIFFVLYGLKNYLGFQVFRMQCRFVYGVASRLSRDNMAAYLQGSFQDYVRVDSSIHNRRIGQQPIEFCHHVLGGFQQIAGQSMLIIITIAAILFFSPVLFPLLVLILMPPVVLAAYLLKRKLHVIRKSAKTVGEKTLQHLQEALSGFVESNLYDRAAFFIKRYDKEQRSYNSFLAEQLATQNMPSRLIEVFAVFGLFVLILINTYSGHANGVQIITLGAFMAASYKIIPGIVKILNFAGQIRTYEYTIRELLQKPARAAFFKIEPAASTLRSIALENIHFSYKKKSVLDDFSLSVSRGDFTGISGISGIGKTTILNILLGFLKPVSGDLRINGIITDINTLERYRGSIAYVKQQPFLIHDTILTNITLSENEYDENRLRLVADVCGLSAFAGPFPEGLNKMISENGRDISGGQRQRIAIARALYKNADLLILDEPFNELDEASETALLRYLRKLSQDGKMILLVTHNKLGLSFCNRVISLDEIHVDEPD